MNKKVCCPQCGSTKHSWCLYENYINEAIKKFIQGTITHEKYIEIIKGGLSNENNEKNKV